MQRKWLYPQLTVVFYTYFSGILYPQTLIIHRWGIGWPHFSDLLKGILVAWDKRGSPKEASSLCHVSFWILRLLMGQCLWNHILLKIPATYGHSDVLMLAIEILNYIGKKKTFPTRKGLLESLCLRPEGPAQYKSDWQMEHHYHVWIYYLIIIF